MQRCVNLRRRALNTAQGMMIISRIFPGEQGSPIGDMGSCSSRPCSSVSDVLDEWMTALETDRFADEEGENYCLVCNSWMKTHFSKKYQERLLLWEQLTLVLQCFGRSLLGSMLDKYPGFPLLLIMGTSEESALASVHLWNLVRIPAEMSSFSPIFVCR